MNVKIELALLLPLICGCSPLQVRTAHTQSSSLRLELHKSELIKDRVQQFNSLSEKAQYYEFAPFFKNEDEELEFLELPSLEQREAWAHSRKLIDRKTQYDSIIEQGDLVKGMPKESVSASWGPPSERWIAGNSIQNNEKWTYYTETPTENGYLGETRVLYFEHGRLIGWQTQPTK